MAINSRSDRQRHRRLAADDRVGIWNRRQNREQRLHVLRSNLSSFVSVGAAGAVIIAVGAVFIPWEFARGLFVGVSAAALISLIGYVVLALSGTVARGMGATAEMWTATELRRLRRDGWEIINGVSLEGRDIDHVLVGPSGVIVVESKWSANGWDLTMPDRALIKAVDQAVANARSLRLWRAIKASGSPVKSAVVLWGGNRAGAPERPSEPLILGETAIAFGLTAVRHWLNAIARLPEAVAPATVDNVWRELDRFVANREDRDQAVAPPVSADRMLWNVVATTIAFVATLLGCLETFARTHSWTLFLGSIALFLAVWLLLRRWPVTKAPAAGGITGVAVASTLGAASVIVAALGK